MSVFTILFVLPEALWESRWSMLGLALASLVFLHLSRRGRPRLAAAVLLSATSLFYLATLIEHLPAPLRMDDEEARDNARYADIALGQTKEEVLRRIGRPDYQHGADYFFVGIRGTGLEDRASRVIGFEIDRSGRVTTKLYALSRERLHNKWFLPSGTIDHAVFIEGMLDKAQSDIDTRVPNNISAFNGTHLSALLSSLSATMNGDKSFDHLATGIEALGDMSSRSKSGDWKGFLDSHGRLPRVVVRKEPKNSLWDSMEDQIVLLPGGQEIRIMGNNGKGVYYLTARFEGGYD